MLQTALLDPTEMVTETKAPLPEAPTDLFLQSGATLNNNLLYTHNFFPYPAKFPAHSVRDFLTSYSQPGDCVLDPFSGSGTVLVEAILHSRNACGLELNPVAALVASAKATLYRCDALNELNQAGALLIEAQKCPQKWTDDMLCDGGVPEYKNVMHWFQPVVLRELAALRKAICESEQWSQTARKLMWMAFLKNIVPLSNQDTETRYAAIAKPEMPPGFAIKKMRDTLADYHKALQVSQPALKHIQATATVKEGDTLNLLPQLPCASFNLAITSPPYLNTFDYYLYHKHRIFWMGRDPSEIRRKEVGCHHRVDAMSYEVATNEYRSYLEGVLRGVHTALKDGGRFVVLIGDGIVKKRMLKADDLMRELAQATNFEVECIESLNLSGVSRRFIKDARREQKNHHIVVLRK